MRLAKRSRWLRYHRCSVCDAKINARESRSDEEGGFLCDDCWENESDAEYWEHVLEHGISDDLDPEKSKMET